jgi:hypothetical protein
MSITVVGGRLVAAPSPAGQVFNAISSRIRASSSALIMSISRGRPSFVRRFIHSAWMPSTRSKPISRASNVSGPMRCGFLAKLPSFSNSMPCLAQAVLRLAQLAPQHGLMTFQRREVCPLAIQQDRVERRILGRQRAADAAGPGVDLFGLVAAVGIRNCGGAPVAELCSRRPVLQPLPHMADAPVEQRRQRREAAAEALSVRQDLLIPALATLGTVLAAAHLDAPVADGALALADTSDHEYLAVNLLQPGAVLVPSDQS